MKWDFDSLPKKELNLGSLDENYETKPPDQQALEAKNCFPCIFAPSEKCRGRNCKCMYKMYY